MFKTRRLQVHQGTGYCRFNPVTFCACPKPVPGCTSAFVVVVFVFNTLKWELVICFVDIDRIVHDHCLTFLFQFLITMLNYYLMFQLKPCIIQSNIFSYQLFLELVQNIVQGAPTIRTKHPSSNLFELYLFTVQYFNFAIT
jgi:hypothetical protein